MRRSVKPGCQVQSFDLSRKENSPFMYCITCLIEMFSVGVTRRWIWSGITTKAWS